MIFERHEGALLLADPLIVASPPNDEADSALKLLMKMGGFVAGSAARAVLLSYKMRLSFDQVSDQFNDIDVYFRGDPPDISLLPGEWTSNAAAYLNEDITPPSHLGGAWFRRFYAIETKNDGTLFGAAKSFVRAALGPTVKQSRRTVTINVITFKRGAVEHVLRDFDITSSQVAIDGNDVICPEGYMKRELAGELSVNRQCLESRASEHRLFKTLERLTKYSHRMRSLGIVPRISQADAKTLIDLMSDEDALKARKISWGVQRELGRIMSFEDAFMLSTLIFRDKFIISKLLVEAATTS